MMSFLLGLLALLLITAGVHLVHARRNGRSGISLLSLGAVSQSWLTAHREEQR